MSTTTFLNIFHIPIYPNYLLPYLLLTLMASLSLSLSLPPPIDVDEDIDEEEEEKDKGEKAGSPLLPHEVIDKDAMAVTILVSSSPPTNPKPKPPTHPSKGEAPSVPVP